MKRRTVYGVNARGRYVAREERRREGGVYYWAELWREYEDQMLSYPESVERGIGPECAAKGGF